MNLTTILAWLSLLERIQKSPAAGAVMDKIKAALAAHGIEADNAVLDGIIVDAARQKALAEAEARPPSEPGA